MYVSDGTWRRYHGPHCNFTELHLPTGPHQSGKNSRQGPQLSTVCNSHHHPVSCARRTPAVTTWARAQRAHPCDCFRWSLEATTWTEHGDGISWWKKCSFSQGAASTYLWYFHIPWLTNRQKDIYRGIIYTENHTRDFFSLSTLQKYQLFEQKERYIHSILDTENSPVYVQEDIWYYWSG